MPCGEGPGMEWTPGTGGWGGRDHSSWVAKSNLIITPPLTTPIGGTTPRRDQEEGLEMGRAAGDLRSLVELGCWTSLPQGPSQGDVPSELDQSPRAGPATAQTQSGQHLSSAS